MTRSTWSDGSPSAPRRRRALVVPGVLVVTLVVALTVIAARFDLPRSVETRQDSPSVAAPLASAPSVVPRAAQPAAPLRFNNLKPGSTLPTDAQCAARVHKTPEAVPANARYNATRGGQRLPANFFDPASHDRRANTVMAARVTGSYTGTTSEILQWTACKWGIDGRLVRAQAALESGWRQAMLSDWTTKASACAPGHGLGVDGWAGHCPESFGVLQVKYQFFKGSFPGVIRSTSFNTDTAYAVWRACYEGYEEWLSHVDSPDRPYRTGDGLGCMGRWFSGDWYDVEARAYIAEVLNAVRSGGPA